MNLEIRNESPNLDLDRDAGGRRTHGGVCRAGAGTIAGSTETLVRYEFRWRNELRLHQGLGMREVDECGRLVRSESAQQQTLNPSAGIPMRFVSARPETRGRDAGIGLIRSWPTTELTMSMYTYLTAAMLGGVLTVAAADNVPTLNTKPTCAGADSVLSGTRNIASCEQSELQARNTLGTEWQKFSASDKRSCVEETNIGGFPSYVQVLTCLEMARDARAAE
jgi:hypothetical protein